MPAMLNHQNDHILGLDIGARSIKMVESRLERGKMEILRFGEAPLAAEIIENGEIRNPEALSQNLKNALKNLKISAKQVVASLPESKTFVTLLHLKEESSPMPARVQAEIERQIPFELREVYWDWKIAAREPLSVAVLVGAAPKILADSYAAFLENSGLTVLSLEPEPLAIARATVGDLPPANCTLIADLGAMKSTLIITSFNAVVSTADAKSSSEALTNQIAQLLKIEPPAAETLKRDHGLQNGPPEYKSAVEKYANNLAHRIQEMMNITLSGAQVCSGVMEILLVGGGALLAGLPEFLSNILKIPVRHANPLIHFDTGKSVNISPAVSIRLATACGLALQKILPNENSR